MISAILITGPIASGKTTLANQLRRTLDGKVVICDDEQLNCYTKRQLKKEIAKLNGDGFVIFCGENAEPLAQRAAELGCAQQTHLIATRFTTLEDVFRAAVNTYTPSGKREFREEIDNLERQLKNVLLHRDALLIKRESAHGKLCALKTLLEGLAPEKRRLKPKGHVSIVRTIPSDNYREMKDLVDGIHALIKAD